MADKTQETERREGHAWTISIDGHEYQTHDPVVSGRQVLDIAGKHPVDDFIVYWLGKDNVLEDLGLDKTVHLAHHGVQKFFVFDSDRSYRFEIEGKREDWARTTISEETLRKIAGVGSEYRVWLEQKDKPAHLIQRGEFVDLTAPGIEKFYLEHIIFVRVENEDSGDHVVLEGLKTTIIESLIDKIYEEFHVQRKNDDRLRCETGGDVFGFSKLTLGEYIEAGHCPCMIWLFVSGTGGASCR